MKPTEQEAGRFSACGYGLMGLCCSSCLLGPCRISPFERESVKGQCGDNADLMVAKNLLRLVAGEAAGGLKDLSGAVRKLRALDLKQGTRKYPCREALKGIVEKYGLPSKIPVNRFIHYLITESERLLSPLSEPERPSSLLSSLYPEDAFPHIHRNSLLPSSLASLIFDSLSHEQRESSVVELILLQCLKTSMLGIIIEELCRDMRYLTDGEWTPETERGTLDFLEHLPPNPMPAVFLFSDHSQLYGEVVNRTAKGLRQELRGDIPIFRINHIATLPDIGRRFSRSWSLSPAEVGTIAVVFSQSVAFVIGTMVCGFAVTSFPPLPIHGSKLVERFFCEDLRGKIGSRYLSPRTGEVIPTILESLREKL